MYIAVLTTSKIKVFETSHMHSDKIDEEVKQKYGTQPSGLPHNWTGVYSIKRIQKLVQDFCNSELPSRES